MRIGLASSLSRKSLFRYASGCDIRSMYHSQAKEIRVRYRRLIVTCALAAGFGFVGTAEQGPAGPPALHAKGTKRLVVRGAMVIYGSAKPPYGPVDITIEDGRIASIAPPQE